MSEPIIEYQCEFYVRKVRKIPDRRFRSGYRSIETLAVNVSLLTPGMSHRFALINQEQRADGRYYTQADGVVSLQMSDHEVKL